jgi:hypothetical protein
MHALPPACGISGCLRRRGHTGRCAVPRSPLSADDEALALALLKPNNSSTEDLARKWDRCPEEKP